MRSQLLVSATDLDSWAAQRIAEAQLPRLVRRLVHATGGGVRRLEFRADEGVQIGGWDGIVIAEEGNEFVPPGVSGWELGTNQKIKAKADHDYQTRSTDPGEVNPKQTTFVFVTPRRWGGKDRWVAARRAEGRWRDVRAYDADNLETWLETAPAAVHIWISILLGKHPETAIDLENWWESWSGATEPAVSPGLVISGRTDAANHVVRWLEDTPSTLAVQADSREEALAFLAAVIEGLPVGERNGILARAVVAHDVASWNHLSASAEPLLLIPMFEEREMAAAAVRGGHHVLVPLGRGDGSSPDTIELPRVRREQAQAALVSMGLPEERAGEMATLARRGLLSLRRRIAVLPELQRPRWATAAGAASLMPAVLVGAWNDAAQGDRDLLARLARAPYEEVSWTIVRWANESDPPVRRVGELWYLVSKEDAWLLLGRYLTPDDLTVFETAVLDVLGAPDPHYDLPVGERYIAGVLGIASSYSGQVRESLAETLALMGALSGSIRFTDGSLAEDRAGRVVRLLLDRANSDWRVWASLSFVLPKLAEAAPDVFLDAAERSLAGDDPVLPKLFQDGEQGAFFNSSPHTELLWALETVAWSPEHLGRAAVVLAKLADYDPGGRLANRPINSLREIFLFWHPQTAASVEQRLRVLDVVRQRVPEIGWRLLTELLPERHSSAARTAAPRWREWVPEVQPQVTFAELWRATDEVTRRLLEEAGMRGSRWASLIESLEILTRDSFEAVLEGLRRLKLAALQRSDQLTIWSALRHAISRHRNFADAEWALPAEFVDRLEPLYRRFAPQDAVQRHSWVFADDPGLLRPKGEDFDAQDRAVWRARLRAARTLYNEGGVNSIVKAAEISGNPFIVGATVGRGGLLESEEEEFLTHNLGSSEGTRTQLTQGFVIGRYTSHRWKWADNRLVRSEDLGWSNEQLAEFLRCLPFGPDTWSRIRPLESEIQRLYWSRVVPHAVAGPAEAVLAAENLIQCGRPYAAIRLMAFHFRKEQQAIPSRLAVEALQQALQTDPRIEGSAESSRHAIERLMGVLQSSGDVDEETLARLEWGFLPLFRSRGRSPRSLHRALAQQPELFAEVLVLVYKAEGEEDVEVTEEVAARAELGHDLLESWRSVPGLSEDGTVDEDELRRWVNGALEAAARNGRRGVAIREIGKLLRYAPSDPDGTWPVLAVRNLIEELASEALEQAFEIEVYNSRGVTTRSLTAGGGQERELMERYFGHASAVNDGWSRTARMLRRIADTYRRDARREDDSAALTEDHWR